jgi:23S rRNA maturation-related 3'-5' exoribonuclease YhaM
LHNQADSTAKIKHLAIATQDPEKTAQFYRYPAARRLHHDFHDAMAMRSIQVGNSPVDPSGVNQ